MIFWNLQMWGLNPPPPPTFLLWYISPISSMSMPSLMSQGRCTTRDALVWSGLGFGPKLHWTAPEVWFSCPHCCCCHCTVIPVIVATVTASLLQHHPTVIVGITMSHCHYCFDITTSDSPLWPTNSQLYSESLHICKPLCYPVIVLVHRDEDAKHHHSDEPHHGKVTENHGKQSHVSVKGKSGKVMFKSSGGWGGGGDWGGSEVVVVAGTRVLMTWQSRVGLGWGGGSGGWGGNWGGGEVVVAGTGVSMTWWSRTRVAMTWQSRHCGRWLGWWRRLGWGCCGGRDWGDSDVAVATRLQLQLERGGGVEVGVARAVVAGGAAAKEKKKKKKNSALSQVVAGGNACTKLSRQGLMSAGGYLVLVWMCVVGTLRAGEGEVEI
ncbi:hypothetical protein EDB83DRAFT_2551600 [Lactarius deliciosus]|nr:hypothetical protein EDB83DRAFT_2551600 [Lactarius deliciosus]